MRLSEAEAALDRFVGIRFGDLFPPEDLVDLKTDKGIVGKLLERSIGLTNTTRTLDFEDGELKTNKCYPDGKPRETMFITQLMSVIDDVLNLKDFETTPLSRKIRNLLYVPVCKDGPTAGWMFLPPIHVDLDAVEFAPLAEQLRKDYYSIARQLREHIETSPDGFIHTSNGRYIQVRSKDAKPYSPIYSAVYGRHVSNKNHAFYFRKDFMHELQGSSDAYPFSPAQ